ncbi:hypothetical protein ACYPKM_01445 [Pseudomonas aeruginosa]
MNNYGQVFESEAGAPLAKTGKVDTFWARIHIAGEKSEAMPVIQHFCKEVPLCVTVQEEEFVYTGGREKGFVVELINYPRFPAEKDEINEKARKLAARLVATTAQDSCLIMTPEETFWYTFRKGN